MAIRIVRNEQGNCINFYGSSNPTYWNACLSAEVDTTVTDSINIINDIITSQTGVTKYEFYQIPYTEFIDKDGNSFTDATAAAEYITTNANVTGVSEDVSLIGQDLDFKLDDTSTSIMFNNGYTYGVNTIKAVADADGTIHIKSNFTNDFHDDLTFFTGLEHTNVHINGLDVNGGINDVVNTLNELFTVGPFESVVITDPYATLVADVNGVDAGYTLEGVDAVDPIGDDLATNEVLGTNRAGILSTATINQAGEYFTFDFRAATDGGGSALIGFGLVHTTDSYNDGKYNGNSGNADPSVFAVNNSAHAGFQFAHYFTQTTGGSFTTYGANAANVQGPAWYNASTDFESQGDYLAGNPVKMKVGIDANSFIEVSSLQNDGATWVLHARSSYPIEEGGEYRLGVKFNDSRARLYTEPKVHLLEPAAPTMNFRYIESPDGNYEYPLFATEEEANYYDENHAGTTGTGTSHTHTYVDDPTNTTWYMPDTGRIMNGSTPPQDAAHTIFMGNTVTYTEITSLTNADLTPDAYSGTNITQEEGTNVNIQIEPQGVTYSTSVDISPTGSGLVYSNGLLSGTLADVGADTTYTVTVTRANSYGSSVGTFTITATDVAPVNTQTTPFTKALDFSGSSERAQQASSSDSYVPMMQPYTNAITSGGLGNTSGDTNARPWACASVFLVDGNSSNQHIWNVGEGAGSTDDNIYLRLDSSQRLYFGWGRSGELNECYITQLATNVWYGFYVGFDGRRYGASNSTAANLADVFDFRLMSSYDSFANSSDPSDWSHSQSTTGGRMDRGVTGSLTIGGRGSNRNFHGKVASFVATTLKLDDAMPTIAEAEEMIKDPVDWIATYKAGETYRLPSASTNLSNFQVGNTSSNWNPANATQVWIMGDGTNDSYSNMIRNQVNKSDQNITRLNMVSMVSNDIETVSISGLT